MPSARALIAALLVSALTACIESTADVQPDQQAELNGRFTGRFISEDQGILLDGFLTLDLSESSTGTLEGTFGLEATVDDGQFQQPIAGAGPLVGSVSSDPVASLSFTATPDFCPNRTIEFSGFFDRRIAGLLISGPIIILDAACEDVHSFPSTISLHR
jgi:hypothetical protein